MRFAIQVDPGRSGVEAPTRTTTALPFISRAMQFSIADRLPRSTHCERRGANSSGAAKWCMFGSCARWRIAVE